MKTYKICTYKDGEAIAKTYWMAISSLTEARKILKNIEKGVNVYGVVNFGIWLEPATALTIYAPLTETHARNKEIK